MAYTAVPHTPAIAMEQFPHSTKTSTVEPHDDDDDAPLEAMVPARDVDIQESSRFKETERRGLLFVWKALFLPAMGLIYLVFCYICHYRLVKVGGSTNPIAHLSITKAGVTTLSIIYVSVSLLPLSSLLSDLKSEEFFRTIFHKDQGAPIASINSISTPSYGMRDMLATLYHRQGSKYLFGTFLAGLMFLAASALAPATLSVDTILFDGDLMAFSVGAIQRNSVMNTGNISSPERVKSSPAVAKLAREAGSIAWAEFSLRVNYSFQNPTIDKTTYIIPVPVDLPIDTRARWLSDVITIQPKCEWIARPFVATTEFTLEKLTMPVESKNMQVELLADFMNITDDQHRIMQLTNNWTDVSGEMRDLSTMDDMNNGLTVWMLAVCVSGCKSLLSRSVNVTFGPDIPTTRRNMTGGLVVDVSFLFCEPNADIHTRHVSNDGRGFLTVGDRTSLPQGNLNPTQTKMLLSYVFVDFDEVGPRTDLNFTGVGNQAQLSFIFGDNPDPNSQQISPQSINNITAGYGRYVQSATKKFVDGSLASAHVPGRTTREIAVFSSSLPHLIVSTILYVVLSAFVLFCHFRRPVPQFTFFAVASSLADSNIPQSFANLRRDGVSVSERSAVATLGNAHVTLGTGQNGLHTLNLRGDLP